MLCVMDELFVHRFSIVFQDVRCNSALLLDISVTGEVFLRSTTQTNDGNGFIIVSYFQFSFFAMAF